MTACFESRNSSSSFLQHALPDIAACLLLSCCLPLLPLLPLLTNISALVAGQARGAAGTGLRQLCLYNFLDIAAALGLALLVNVAVLLVAAATFHQAGERGGRAHSQDSHAPAAAAGMSACMAAAHGRVSHVCCAKLVLRVTHACS